MATSRSGYRGDLIRPIPMDNGHGPRASVPRNRAERLPIPPTPQSLSNQKRGRLPRRPLVFPNLRTRFSPSQRSLTANCVHERATCGGRLRFVERCCKSATSRRLRSARLAQEAEGAGGRLNKQSDEHGRASDLAAFLFVVPNEGLRSKKVVAASALRVDHWRSPPEGCNRLRNQQ
jgi:hypothetical protein